MADRVIVANSIPVTTGDDGVPRVEMTGEFTLTTAVGGSDITFEDASDTAVTLLDASTSRAGFRIQNTSPSAMYLAFKADVVTTSLFTVRLPQYAYVSEDNYRGQVDAVWESGASVGGAAITSFTSEE